MEEQPKIFLINLKQSQDRLEQSTQRLGSQGVAFDRIDAIYGKDLSEAEVAEHYSETLNQEKFYRPLSRGEIGCYFSHRMAWQEIVDQQLDYAIVLEDDFKIVGDLHKVFHALKQLNGQWDIVKLAAYNNRTRPIRYQAPLNEAFDLVVHNKTMTGCCAQAITLAGAKKLLAFSDKFGRPVDTDIQHIWETGVPAVSLMPYFIEQDLSFDSDIGKTAAGIKFKKHFFKRKKQQVVEKWHNRAATNQLIKEVQLWSDKLNRPAIDKLEAI